MKPVRRHRVAAAAVAACGVACRAAPPDEPALVVEPTTASRAALSRAVSELLGVPSVTLADDALTASPLLVVERRALRDVRGMRVTGRDRERPETLRLVKRGDACVLVRLRDPGQAVVVETRCRRAPLEPDARRQP